MAKHFWVDKLTHIQRLELAKERVRDVSNRAVVLVRAYQANLVIQSNFLSDQIGRSYAARAFNSFRENTLHSFISRLMTFWDKSSEHRKSLPSIVDLIDHPDVLSLVWSATHDNGLVGVDAIDEPDPRLKRWAKQSQRASAKERADDRQKRLTDAIKEVRRIEADRVQLALRDFRDVNLAHALTDNAMKVPNARAVHGDEEALFKSTIWLVDEIETIITNSSFSWASVAENGRRDAEALWLGCTFKVLE